MNEGEGIHENRRSALVAVAVLVVLGALGWFLTHTLSESARMQDCLLSGRTNCAPLPQSR